MAQNISARLFGQTHFCRQDIADFGLPIFWSVPTQTSAREVAQWLRPVQAADARRI